MKKVGLFLVVVALLVSLAAVGLAAEGNPGENVTVNLTLNNRNAAYVRVVASFDSSVFELVEYSAASGPAGSNGIVLYDDTKVLPSGSIGSVTLKIKDSAAAGTYNVSASLVECYDINENNGSASVSGGTVTVKGKPATHTHTWGEWKVTKPAAPGVDGEETRVCKDDPSHIETRKIDALPVDHPSTPSGEGPVTPPSVDDPACTHPSTSWKETKAASCTEPGETQRTCDACGEVLESKDIPALGHDDGEWVVVEKPTQTKNGLKQLQCTRCHEVLKEEVIDRMTTEWRYNQSVCSLGIRFRDIKPELTKKWFMFTPIDLSKDGIQTIDLIAANITYAGKVTLQVQDGKVTVNYKVNWPMEKKDMAFTLLPDLASVSNVDMNSMKTYSFGEEISIADDLNGDTNVLLYMLGHVNYDFQDVRNELFVPHSAKYQKLVTELKDLMD